MASDETLKGPMGGQGLSGPVERLLIRGVRMDNPASVAIGTEVDPERISTRGVVFHAGTTISGAKTLISAGVKLGSEAPVTVVNCRLGSDVELKGGFFRESVFLDRANMGSGAQIREGCLLEEEANGNHTVGLKQTILFPFVTLGSLVNFCDVFLAGGTSRRDHSEVGSSYIHFNYTPNQDKATASLLGDVPRGVMLRERPIFLGGQGGLVGPARIGFGTMIAAGEVWRGDCPEGGKRLWGGHRGTVAADFHPGLYGDIRRKVTNSILYIANLLALRQWYRHVRILLPGDGEMGQALWAGAMEILEGALTERVARLEALARKMDQSVELGQRFWPEPARETLSRQQREFRDQWTGLQAGLTDGSEAAVGIEARDGFLRAFETLRAGRQEGYIATIQALSQEPLFLGTSWLTQVVAEVEREAFSLIPSCHV